MSKPKVLVLVDWFAPGFKAGGPIRSAVNFADNLEEEFDIYVLTTDRDLGADAPYPGITADQWTVRSAHQVYYLSPASLRWSRIRDIIASLAPDLVYLNSMFSRYFTLYPLLMRRWGMITGKLVLAPRGMLRSSALAHKSAKKKLFFSVFRGLRLTRDVLFHATDDTESADVRKIFGPTAQSFQAGNLPGRQPAFQPAPPKTKGELALVFVGRIHPIKNLDFLLEAMTGLRGTLTLTVIATLEDTAYWQRCQEIIARLPAGISVRTMIDLPHAQIAPQLYQAQAFALPTKGENFGHAIFEALAAGRPVLISDQTPWRNLATVKAGWDLPLASPDPFRDVLQSLLDMDEAELQRWCRGAWERAKDYLAHADTRKAMISVFKANAASRHED